MVLSLSSERSSSWSSPFKTQRPRRTRMGCRLKLLRRSAARYPTCSFVARGTQWLLRFRQERLLRVFSLQRLVVEYCCKRRREVAIRSGKRISHVHVFCVFLPNKPRTCQPAGRAFSSRNGFSSYSVMPITCLHLSCTFNRAVTRTSPSSGPKNPCCSNLSAAARDAPAAANP